MVNTIAAFAVLAYQMSAAQQAQVLGNGRARNRESFRDLACRLTAASKQIEDGAAGGIGESLKRGFGRLLCRLSGIGNRSVTHNA
jgi:hypothetical protein